MINLSSLKNTHVTKLPHCPDENHATVYVFRKPMWSGSATSINIYKEILKPNWMYKVFKIGTQQVTGQQKIGSIRNRQYIYFDIDLKEEWIVGRGRIKISPQPQEIIFLQQTFDDTITGIDFISILVDGNIVVKTKKCCIYKIKNTNNREEALKIFQNYIRDGFTLGTLK